MSPVAVPAQYAYLGGDGAAGAVQACMPLSQAEPMVSGGGADQKSPGAPKKRGPGRPRKEDTFVKAPASKKRPMQSQPSGQPGTKVQKPIVGYFSAVGAPSREKEHYSVPMPDRYMLRIARRVFVVSAERNYTNLDEIPDLLMQNQALIQQLFLYCPF